MRVRTALLVLVLLCPALAEPASATHEDEGTSWHDATAPYCPVCADQALELATNASFDRSVADIEVRRNGTARWTVRNRVANGSAVPSAGDREAAVRHLLDDHPHVEASDVSVAVEDRTVVVRFTDPEFAEPRVGASLTVEYYYWNNRQPVRRPYNADEMTVRPPPSYRPVGPVRDGRVADRAVVYDGSKEYARTLRPLVFAEEPTATVAGPLVSDLARADARDWDAFAVGHLGATGLVGIAAGLAVFASVSATARKRLSRSGSRAGSRRRLGLLLCVGTVLALAQTRVGPDTRALVFGPLVGLVALAAALYAWRLVDDPMRATTVQVGIVGVLAVASLQAGLAGVVSALVVVAGLAMTGFGAAIGDADRLPAGSYAVVALVAAYAALSLQFAFVDGVVVSFIYRGAVLAAALSLVPPLLVGLVYGVPWRSGAVQRDMADP